MEHILESLNEPSGHLHETTQNPHPDTLGLDLQAVLMVLARWPDSHPKKRNKGVREPDLFSRGSPNELQAFIFQCQIYFRTCKGEFTENTKKIFFAISYLWDVALDYFELFINEAKAYQSFDFWEE